MPLVIQSFQPPRKGGGHNAVMTFVVRFLMLRITNDIFFNMLNTN